MKKIIITFFLLLPAFLMAQSRIIIAGDGVCLRTQPDESYKLVGSNYPHVNTGEEYPCLGVVGDYYKIVFNGGYYYIPTKYGRPRGNMSSSNQSHPDRIIIAGDGVCLRTQPNENSKLVGSSYPHVNTGEIYSCVGVVNGYYKIIFRGATRYIPMQYGRPRN